MNQSIIFKIPNEEIEDVYWQGVLIEMLEIFQKTKINALPVCRSLSHEPGIKSIDATQIIEGIKIVLNAAIIPIVLTAIKEFAAIKKAKQLRVKTDKKEYMFNAMDEKEVMKILTQIINGENDTNSH